MLLALLDSGGTLGLMVLIVVALLRGWVVTRREHEEMRKERDRLLAITLRSVDLADRGTRIAGRAASAVSVLEDEI